MCRWGRRVQMMRLSIDWKTGPTVEMQDSKKSWWLHREVRFRDSHLSSSRRSEPIDSWGRVQTLGRRKLGSMTWTYLKYRKTSTTQAYCKEAQAIRVISKTWGRSRKPVQNRGHRREVDLIYHQTISLSKCSKFKNQQVAQDQGPERLVEVEEEGHTKLRTRISWRAWS